ncbi:hypothetical protein [Leptospira sp. GIMC2001]|uniref:hypothetical protein n=1 Tax=Leptospira sp. GIMC2001 TaxID=1513297 RepID=UPI00234BC12A|nr:hypothetical protein [Leptospira sp. GIMC2001]WCL47973.1 hypothetical protein O4O04_11655 [Leptospira sp. GIMC2001]
MNFKTFESPQKWFRFEYPANWEILVVEGIPAFFDPEDSGVLQINSLEHKEKEADSEQELINYLKIQEIEYNEDLVARFQNKQGTQIVSCEFMKDDRHWCVYSISNGKRLILATFNTDGKITDSMYITLTKILSSIRF